MFDSVSLIRFVQPNIHAPPCNQGEAATPERGEELRRRVGDSAVAEARAAVQRLEDWLASTPFASKQVRAVLNSSSACHAPKLSVVPPCHVRIDLVYSCLSPNDLRQDVEEQQKLLETDAIASADSTAVGHLFIAQPVVAACSVLTASPCSHFPGLHQ